MKNSLILTVAICLFATTCHAQVDQQKEPDVPEEISSLDFQTIYEQTILRGELTTMNVTRTVTTQVYYCIIDTVKELWVYAYTDDRSRSCDQVLIQQGPIIFQCYRAGLVMARHMDKEVEPTKEDVENDRTLLSMLAPIVTKWSVTH